MYYSPQQEKGNKMSKVLQAIQFPSGKSAKNRFMLAPMTNCQSHDDGTLSQDEYDWLVMRAEGGFGIVSTCASHVDAIGKGFPGQLGIFDDVHIPGHQKLVKGIQAHGALAIIQLHHAGMRSPEKLIGEKPVCPSDNEKTGARGLSLEEVKALRDKFIAAAVRAEKCGYDGVEIHGAHGYILAQFLSSEINFRTDEYGGSLENRARLIQEIIDGIREKCSTDFIVGLRLSPERMGMKLAEVKLLGERYEALKQLDFLDISLWDSFKMPEEEEHQDQSLLAHFTSLDFKHIKLSVAGKLFSAKDVETVLAQGVDFVNIGKAGILHHDFPKLVKSNPNFIASTTPVSRAYLKKEGLSPTFIDYMSKWPDFVEE